MKTTKTKMIAVMLAAAEIPASPAEECVIENAAEAAAIHTETRQNFIMTKETRGAKANH